ncbi:response regulator [Algibacter sp. L4_22]|uniref:response regulator n=1 Tax=Algibacter sp. L4_22 TaxID=2942477 RepID=UPI00201B923F|nr:response regulator [Algibacter sp. L4_22]MCL5128129.1 response regulator [Algibacter sp. L4_22]
MKFACFPFLFLVCFCSLGQNDKQSDSAVIAKYKTKVIQYINPKPDSALYYIQKSFKVAKKSSYKKGIADTEYLYAQYFRRTQQRDSALYYFQSSARKSENEKYNIGAAIAYNGLCRNLYLLSEFKEAEFACEKALLNINSEDELSYMTKADTYTALGTIYKQQNFIKKAQIYFLKVDSMHVKKTLRPDVIAAAYQNLGSIYLEFDDLELAESYYLKANNQFGKLPAAAAEYYMSTNNVELGKLYFKQQKLNLADSILTNSQKFFIKIKDLSNAAEIGRALGLIKLDKNQLEEAKVYFTKSFEFYKKSKFNLQAATNALELAKLSLLQNNLQKALSWSQVGIQLNESINNSILKKDLAFVIADVYTQTGEHQKANNLNKIAYKIKDSLSQIQIAETIKEIEEKYQTEQKDKEIKSLKAESDLALQQQKNERNLLVGGLGFTTLAGLFLFVLYRNHQKTNTKLKELDTAKSNFFANISHEFRTPLTLISNPIDAAIEDPSISDKKREQFVMAKRNSDRLLALVNQLLDLSKIDAGQLKLHIQTGNIQDLISGLAESFNYSAKQNHINYQLQIEKYEDTVWFDKDAVEKISINLLSNAIKYTPANGSVTCKSYIENNTWHFSVKNTGVGLTKQEQEDVFTRFYQTDENNQGTGIGLALVKELVELHKGTIKVESKLNEAICFSVTLPIDKNSFKNEVFIASSKITDNYESVQIEASKNIEDDFEDADKPILLIVEDNADVTILLKQTFEDYYNIITAKNGQIGIDLAIEHVPDIIISDIMMPVKDGVALTETLKDNELTSHIPIILLTAKAGDKNELKGIEIGADDYITKPFNSKLLKTKVSNLIAIRQKLQSRYSQEIVLTPKDIAVTNLDEQFLNKVQEILETNLIESSFNVENFSKAVGMSRMQLHRKIKALTGLSASEFVRSQRLKLAAQLLKTSDINISQVGYSVGFNDHSYFAKCFKDTYKCTPTEYAKKHENL